MPAEGPLDGEGSVCDWKVKQANARGEILEAGGRFPRLTRQSLPHSKDAQFRALNGDYLPESFCTISSAFATCWSGEMPSSFEENMAMILWSLPMTKVTRSIMSWSIASPFTSVMPAFIAFAVRL